ncbi:MAG: RDD family protein [Candidatus Rokubacteria bacterium]|nr:RDD family protein [Candidatus Rokubacteria bacterium]
MVARAKPALEGHYSPVSAVPRPGAALRRWLAFQLDQLIFGGLWLLAGAWGGAIYLSVSRRPASLETLPVFVAVLVALGVLLHATYWTAFVGGCGQTPGKMLLSLQVVGRDGSAVGYGRAAWRWVAMGLAVLPLGLGFLGVMLTRDRRGLHDWLAGTRVVRSASE